MLSQKLVRHRILTVDENVTAGDEVRHHLAATVAAGESPPDQNINKTIRFYLLSVRQIAVLQELLQGQDHVQALQVLAVHHRLRLHLQPILIAV